MTVGKIDFTEQKNYFVKRLDIFVNLIYNINGDVKMGAFVDLTGQRFGRLVVVKQMPERKNGRVLWECKCDCGNTTYVASYSLKSGHAKSCGCLHLEKNKTNRITHGFSKTERLYNVWKSMRQRCNCETNQDYKHYGGRGIEVCEEWQESYLTFRNWAMSNGYENNLSIDRIDVDGDYCPENCRWVTQYEQTRNCSRNHYITYNGETLTITDMAEKYNINIRTLKSRLDAGWSIEDALMKPILGSK